MSLYKREGSPFWQYSFQYRGSRFRGSTETESKPEAKRIEGEKRAEAKVLLARRNRKELTLNEAFDRYCGEIEGQPSYDDSERMLANVLSIGKDRLLSDVTGNDVALYVARRRADRNKRGELVSNATVNRDVEALRRVMRRAKDGWDIHTAKINWGEHKLPEADERARELTAKEQAALLDNLREDFRPFVTFAFLSGLRLANVIRLTWKNIDYDSMTITVRIKSKKPEGKNHTIPINPAMLEVLAAQRGDHPIYVFTYECKRSRGQRRKSERYPFSKNGWRKDWAKALEAAGIEDFRFHDLRHTAATRIVRNTGNLKMAMRLLGHADISTTIRYAHVTDQDLRDAMASSHNTGHSDVAGAVKTSENQGK